MNFVIEKKLLHQSLQKIVGVISVRPRLPILGHILLEINNNYLFMTATDLEIEITTKVLLNDNTYSDKFSATVSGRKFFDICRGFSECAKISVGLENGKLIVKSGSISFMLSTFSTVDFPKLELYSNVIELEISQIVLKKMIELTQFSMGNQDIRYYLNGMFVEIKDNIICIVTTDGHRLAMCSVAIDSVSLFHAMIISRKGVFEILRLLSIDKRSSSVNITVNNHSICLKIHDDTITAKLIDAVFPNYHSVFIKKSNNVLEVLCDSLKKSLKRAAIIANEKCRNVNFFLITNVLKITARNFENEILEETLDVVYTGQNMNISFNINYLLDIVNVVNTQVIRFVLIDALSSVKIEGITKYYDEKYVVMPIRI